MAAKLISNAQVTALYNGYDVNLGFEYLPVGSPNWWNYLLSILNQEGKMGIGNLFVCADDADNTTIRIMPGTCSTASGATILTYAGGTVELSANNNTQTYVWLYDNAGVATIGTAVSGTGWPGTAHLKLAIVTIAAGAITQITDLRWKTMLQF